MTAAEQAVLKCLTENGMTEKDLGHRPILLVALSGGADSMLLLYTLVSLYDAGHINILTEAVYIQHDLRGHSSMLEQMMVMQHCREHRVMLAIRYAHLNGTMEQSGIEEAARAERYRLILETAEWENVDAVLCAHHGDDQAETVLMRLLRGSGAEGLCAMRPAVPFGQGLLLRPFLSLSKQQILDELAQTGWPHYEDESNAVPCTARNRLRLNVLPGLEEMFPGCRAHMADTAEALQADCDALTHYADEAEGRCLWLPHEALPVLRRDELGRLPEAVRRRVLRRYWLNAANLHGHAPDEHSLSHADTVALSDLSKQGGRMNLPCGLQAVCRSNYLYITPPKALAPKTVPVPLSADGSMEIGTLHITVSPTGQIPRTAESVWLSDTLLAEQPVFRTARPGDVIQPFGAPGHKPLRRYFTDIGLDTPLRGIVPLLCAGSEVLWIPGICASERTRAGDTASGLLLTAAGCGDYRSAIQHKQA